jgi:hypothetical protein
MKEGNVYKIMDGVFGIVVFRYPGSNKTELLCRFMDCETVREACKELGEMFAGKFVPCDTDLAAWGRAIMRNRGSAILLTDN